MAGSRADETAGVALDGETRHGHVASRPRDELTAALQEIERLRAEKESVERLAEARARWLAHVSHELRTPMNGIIGMTELILETQLTDQQRDQLGLVRRSADSLLTLVNDILDHTKITSNKLAIEAIPFNLRDAVTDVMATMAAVNRGRDEVALDTWIDPDVPGRVVGDPGRLRQIIVNLVGNAAKFTTAGSVALRVAREPGAPPDRLLLRFTIADTGIGIPPDKLDGIFEPFAQAGPSTSREYGGTGLGLAICRQLVELMGGTISVTSEVDRGTEFTFTVAMEIAPQRESTWAHERLDLATIRVLILSDSLMNQELLLDVAESERIGAMVVENLDEAITYIQKAKQSDRPIDLLVLDLHVAGMEIAATVMQQDVADTRVLLLTPTGQRGDAARCRAMGIAAYLTGALHPEDLAAAMRAVAEGTPDLVTRHWLRERHRPLRVLFADDSSTNRLLTQRILERQGHAVHCVSDGAAAVAAHSAADYDVVVLDVEMPVMDGPAAASAIRKTSGRAGGVPIVALTGHVTPEDRTRFLAAGIDEVLHKPVQADALGSLLQRLVDAPSRRA